MMFLLDLAFAAELIALAFGVGFLVWACRNNGSGVGLAKFFGYLITLLAIFALLCTSYFGINYWVKGYFKTPAAHMTMMDHEKHSDMTAPQTHQDQ